RSRICRYAIVRTDTIAVGGCLCGGGVIEPPLLMTARMRRQRRRKVMLLRWAGAFKPDPRGKRSASSADDDLTDLDDRGLVGIVWDVLHDLLRMRPKSGLECLDRVTEDVA